MEYKVREPSRGGAMAKAEAEVKKKKANSTASLAKCSECGRKGSGTRLAFKLCPRSYRPMDHRLLCLPCRTRLGFIQETWGREHLNVSYSAE